MMTAKEYIDSLRKLNTRVYMFGERIENWVDHPMIRPSINCVAMTYALAQDPQHEDLMTATSNLTGRKINRFAHLHQSSEDLVKKGKTVAFCGMAEPVRMYFDRAGITDLLGEDAYYWSADRAILDLMKYSV